MVTSAQISYPDNSDEKLESDEERKDGASAEPVSEGTPDDMIQADAEDESDVEVDELSPKELGAKGEEAAVRYLEIRGYEIIDRNWICRFGEADIIAYDPEGVLCFIEVKTRRGVDAGLPEESITRKKQARYERIALCYLMEYDDWDDNDPVRFDAIGICVSAPHRALLRHHRGCFNGCF